MIHNKLGKKKFISRPMKCVPGVEVIITDIHKEDINFDIRDMYINQEAILTPTVSTLLYSRSEHPGLKDKRDTYVATNLKIGNKIIYFTAVRFVRKTPALSTWYKHNPKRSYSNE